DSRYATMCGARCHRARSSPRRRTSPRLDTALLFFDRGEPVAQPGGLCLGISPSQTLAGTLHGEPELVQHSGDMVVVVSDAEALLDEIADHRPGPHPTGISGSLRARLNPGPQFVLLWVG